jgi:WD40 repeat protein
VCSGNADARDPVAGQRVQDSPLPTLLCSGQAASEKQQHGDSYHVHLFYSSGVSRLTFAGPWALTLLVSLAVSGTAQEIPTRALVPGEVVGSGTISQLSYSPNGRLLAVLTTVGFQIRDSESGRLLNTVLHPNPYFAGLYWSPDGKQIALASGGITIWRPMGAKVERTLTQGNEELRDAHWSPSGRQIAARTEREIVIFDAKSDQRITLPVQRVEQHGLPQLIGGMSWGADGKELAVMTGQGESEAIDLWDVGRQALVKTIPAGEKQIQSRGGISPNASVVVVVSRMDSKVEWSPDGRVLALYSGDTGLSLWDPHTGSLQSLYCRLRQPRPDG